jgi:hypothetical protein
MTSRLTHAVDSTACVIWLRRWVTRFRHISGLTPKISMRSPGRCLFVVCRGAETFAADMSEHSRAICPRYLLQASLDSPYAAGQASARDYLHMSVWLGGSLRGSDK